MERHAARLKAGPEKDLAARYIDRFAKAGPAIFNRPSSRFFKRDHLLAAKAYYERHGGKTIIIARFIPLIRTFAPVVAGAAKMEYRKFLSFNVFGGIASCATIAEALVKAGKEVGFKVPVVVRLEGNEVEKARDILSKAASELPTLKTAADLTGAAKMVVELSK